MNSRKVIPLIGVFILLFPVWIPSIAEYMSNERIAATSEEEIQPIERDSTESEEVTIQQPHFFFSDNQLISNVNEMTTIQIESDLAVNEVTVLLPNEAKIQDESFVKNQVVQEVSEGQWIIQSETDTKTFELVVAFEQKGEYEISLLSEDGIASASIIVGESQEELPENNVTETNSVSNEENEAIEEPISEVVEEKDINEVESAEIADEKIAGRSNEVGWGTIQSATNIIEVATWTELNNAITNGFTGTEAHKNNSDYIKITADIANPGNLGTGDTRRNAPASRVDYVIDGQGFIVDFNTVRFTWPSSTTIERNIYIKNIKMYGQSAYGPFAIGDYARLGSTITYENVYYEGSQLSASWQAEMYFKGVNEFHSVNSYVSPLTGTVKSTWTNQSGIEAFRAIYEEGSHTTVSVENGNGFILASYLGNTGQTSGQPAFAHIKKDAELNILTKGNSGEIVGTGANIIGLFRGDLILDERAKVNLETLEGTTRGGINMGTDTTINLADAAELNISINGPMNGQSAINLGARAKVNVSDEAKLEVNLNNQGTNTRDVVLSGADSEFIIGTKAIFNIKLNDGTGERNLFNIGARGVFQFSDAYSIDLDARQNPNAHMINMSNPGNFRADVQKVSAWLKTEAMNIEPSKVWNPIYGVNVTYNGRNTTAITANSITDEVRDDFIENYRTTASGSPHSGFSRILYEHIPDVIITLNGLTNNENLDHSHVITGTATPGSYIRFSGDNALPEATILAPGANGEESYHTQADIDGNYRFELSQNQFFTGGNTVIAYAFLNGKSNTTSTVVDEIPTEVSPLDPLNPEIEIVPENQPELPAEQGLVSIDFVSQFDFGINNISAHDQIYYSNPQRLLDENNEVIEAEERPNYIQISDRRGVNNRAGWELSVTQGEQFRTVNGKELTGAQIQFANAELISVEQQIKPEFVSRSQSLLPGTRHQLIIAENEEGQGTWIYRFGDASTGGESVSLEVPKGSTPEATKYSTTLNWELSAVPTN